ncbi:MAG: hypothetical protein P8X67_08465 [Syntrophobacterales bacterium]|jgi:hypothetical protein
MGELKVTSQDGKVVEIGNVRVYGEILYYADLDTFSFRFDTEGRSGDLLKSMGAEENLFGLNWQGEIGADDEGVYMMVRPEDGISSLEVR